MNHIGERIREFRKAAGLSQEKLAESLGVTSQAVSKWETCAAMPDLTMLIPLSNLLGVTTDRLLGTDEIRMRELNDEWFRLMRKYGEGSEEMIEHERRALLEFPEDFTWNYRLAVDLIFSADNLTDPDQRQRRLESSLVYLRILERLAADGKAEDPHRCAESFLVDVLTKLDRREEARKIAENSPNKDRLLKICLTGEEREIHVKSLICDRLFDLLVEIRASQDPDTLEAGYQLILSLFPDSVRTDLHVYLFDYDIKLAEQYTAAGQPENAVKHLVRAMKLVHDCDAVPHDAHTFTSPLLSGAAAHRKYRSRRTMNDFYVCIASPIFDPLRDRPDFSALNPGTEA